MANVNAVCTARSGDEELRSVIVPQDQVAIQFEDPSVLEGLPEGTLSYDPSGAVVVANEAGEAIADVPGGSPVGLIPESEGLIPVFFPPDNCAVTSGWDVFTRQWGILGGELWTETKTVLGAIIGGLPYFIGYVLIILLFMVLWRAVRKFFEPKQDFTSLKTVTFGDESAVRSEFPASVISVVLIFVIWAMFTGSKLLPGFMHLPGPFVGDGSFSYVSEDPEGNRGEAEIFVRVVPFGSDKPDYEVETGDGSAQNDSVVIATYSSELVLWDRNDALTRRDSEARIVEINGDAVDFDHTARDANGNLTQAAPTVNVGFADVTFTDKGTLNVVPHQGWQMQPLYLPAPEAVWARFIEILNAGYQNVYLLVHLGFSLFRVIVGFLLGAAIGIPLGYAMGLSNWFRGWFDPIVEFMRPVPPLALIPLVIIWFGIGEVGKITLLFLAALWIMAIAARAGVSGVAISKVHAAYSLGATRSQILRHVIVPNSLPEIFTGARVAMGVCWGTVVAAELVAAEEGIGKMITTASKFQDTYIILMGVIVIGVIGFGIDVFMRWLERRLVPWKGRV